MKISHDLIFARKILPKITKRHDNLCNICNKGNLAETGKRLPQPAVSSDNVSARRQGKAIYT
jgi:hypothetical protein